MKYKDLRKSIIRILSWGIAYYSVIWLSLRYFVTSEGIAVAWPPIGIFIAAIILTKPHERPFLIILLFPAELLADLHTDMHYYYKLIYASLSAGNAIISAYILLRVAEKPITFSRSRSFWLYVFFSVILCNGFFSVLVSIVTHFQSGSDIISGFLYSWVAAGVGNIMVVPLIISWSSFSINDLKNIRTRRTLEVLLLLTLLVGLNIMLFPYTSDGLLYSFIINYLSFPFIIWAVFRFDMKVVTIVLLLLASVMVFNLIRDRNLATDTLIDRQFIFFQLYIALVAIISVMITAITEEKNQAHKALIESEHNYRTVADYTYAWEYWIDDNGKIRYMSPAVEEITGYTADQFKSDPSILNDIIYADDKHIWERHSREIDEINHVHQSKLEFRIVSRDRVVKWIGHDCRRIYNGDIYMGLRVSNRDITSLVEAERKLLFNTVETEEKERGRYSRELHDGLGPLLSTIKMYIQSLSEATDPRKIKMFTDEINNIIKITIHTMREIAHGISPFNLSHSGYVESMIDFAEKINKTHKLTIDFVYNTKVRFNNFYEIILYRITTELINNTIKHSEAGKIVIDFNFKRGQKTISLKYSDDGCGFELSDCSKPSIGMGLSNIQYRLKMLRGNFQINTAPGKGVQIFIDLPVNEKDIKASAVSDAINS